MLNVTVGFPLLFLPAVILLRAKIIGNRFSDYELNGKTRKFYFVHNFALYVINM